ncbi:MAG TPA: SIR2 family protein [Chitinophagaceae bacterium]|nr:SIR2 family protein [Chitinophagaceae bacterium]
MAIDTSKNNVYIEGNDILPEWEADNKTIYKVMTILKSYLELDNVSFLFGAGSSINLGSVSIANIPTSIEDKIKATTIAGGASSDLYDEFISIVKELQDEDPEVRTASKEIKYPLELFLNYLVANEYIADLNPDGVKHKYLNDLIKAIKEQLFKLCDLEKLPLPSWLSGEVKDNLIKNKGYYHEKFVKKILQRPLNLKRANIFTTNYDLAFEYAFDKLGVHNISGFSGFQKRTFKPETFEYDIFFPGSTTQGKVQKIEKVLKYYKIHGSLTWIKENPSPNNVYGISEVPIEQIRTGGGYENIMIYPTTAKKSFTLDFPYSELFRQFSATISQSQSTLITYGYSFSDEHINDIIYQALTIPSFTLVIIDFNGTKGSKEILKLKELNDPRIIIIQGEKLGSLPFFVESLLPDLIEANTYERIAETLKKVLDKNIASSLATGTSSKTSTTP